MAFVMKALRNVFLLTFLIYYVVNDYKTETENEAKAYQDAARLIATFALALQSLHRFQCFECINYLNLLPVKHFRSGWVQHVLGRPIPIAYDDLSIRSLTNSTPFERQSVFRVV
jgi:hypothetical protein